MKASFRFIAALSALVLLGVSCKPKCDNIAIIDKALNDKESAFYADFKSYPKTLAELPIGVFDSGTGGLTVLEKFLEMPEYNGEDFVYLADQANMPYGRYDACGKSDYLRELVVKDALFLLGRPVKIIVIGCNTATAYGLGSVRSMLEQSKTGVKVIGVINAGVKATLDQIGSSLDSCAIGVLATPGTIASGAYERTIKEECRNRGMRHETVVTNQKGYGFAEAVDAEPDFVDKSLTSPRASYLGPHFGDGDADIRRELLPAYNFDMGGVLFTTADDGSFEEFQLNDASNYARFNLVSLVERHRQSGSTLPIKAIIMGCTHYPFALETMKESVEHLRSLCIDGEYPYRDILCEDLIFIDPAAYTALECYYELFHDGNLSSGSDPATVSAYISVPAPGLDPSCLTETGALSYDFKYGRETGTEDISTIQVPFSKDNVDAATRERIHRLLPLSYDAIKTIQDK